MPILNQICFLFPVQQFLSLKYKQIEHKLSNTEHMLNDKICFYVTTFFMWQRRHNRNILHFNITGFTVIVVKYI